MSSNARKKAPRLPAPRPSRRRWQLLGLLSAVLVGLTCAGAYAATSAAPAKQTLAQAVQAHAKAKGVNKDGKAVGAGIAMTKPPSKGVDPGDATTIGSRTGGCTPGYGKGKQCLAITPPSAAAMSMTVAQMPWTCTEVKTIFSQGIPVNVKGVDPAHLDGNKDGVACDTGDAG